MTGTTVPAGTLRAPVLKVALALGAVYVIWGSTYLAIRFAIETMPPFLMAATRYLAAASWLRLVGRAGCVATVSRPAPTLSSRAP